MNVKKVTEGRELSDQVTEYGHGLPRRLFHAPCRVNGESGADYGQRRTVGQRPKIGAARGQRGGLTGHKRRYILAVRQGSAAACVRASRAALGGQDPRSGLVPDSRGRKSRMTFSPRGVRFGPPRRGRNRKLAADKVCITGTPELGDGPTKYGRESVKHLELRRLP